VKEFQGKELLGGTVAAQTLTLGAPLSLWDGIDSSEGIIVQSGHPNEGQSIANVILVISQGLSGATGGGSLTECFRKGNGPVAMILPEAEPMVVAASVVAGELYDKQIPILQVEPDNIIQIPNGVHARVENGVITIE
jgi:predicted aconitase with swiveling domain